jgi:ABC-type nitrate/sulfonate/bicarbonate transport system substrate-binding protein
MKNKPLDIVRAATLLVVFSTTFLSCGPEETLPPVFDHNLENHPIYKTYDFGDSSRVLDIGTQPLLYPTGLITEVLKRDRIYKDALMEHGIEIRFHPFLKGRDINHFLGEGKLDAGIGGDAPTLAALATLNAVAPVVVQRGFVSIIASRPMLLRDLKGQRIGYARGSNAHYALLAALGHRDLKPDDVELVPMDITQMASALDLGIVDAFSAWEPTPAEALNAHPDFVTVHQHIGTGFMYFAESLENSHPEAMPYTVAAVVRAIAWLRASKKNLHMAAEWFQEKTLELSGTPSSLSKAQIGQLAEQELIGLYTLPELPADDLKQNGPLQKEFEFLVELGNIPPDVPWEKVHRNFRNDIMEEVLKSHEQYRFDEFSYDVRQADSPQSRKAANRP